MTVVVDVLIAVVLFALTLVLAHERPRTWLFEACRAAAVRYGRPEHTPAWELEHAELWLMARRQQLTRDLHRIERLLLHDETMSATRQLGNRLARDQLVASLARIPDVLPGRDRSFSYELVEPAGSAGARGSTGSAGSAGARGSTGTRPGAVEVLDVGGWR